MTTNKLSPEERLKRYKANLEKMAEKEGREVSSTKSVQEEITKSPGTPETPFIPAKRTTPLKVKTFVSPSKLELEELKKAMTEKAQEKKKPALSGRSLTMLRVRSKALAKALTEMKVKREKLERKHDRAIIDEDEYQRMLAELVSEGHGLLREKTEIDEEIKILESTK